MCRGFDGQRQLVPLRGGRKGQVGDLDLGHVDGAAPPLSDLRVGAHRKGGDRYEGVGAPFGHGLRHQGQGGHQVQDVAALAGQFLGDAQARQGLAGAARHDELAAVGILQPAHGFFKGLGLIVPQRLGLRPDDIAGRRETGPIDPAITQILKADRRGGNRLAGHHLARVVAPRRFGRFDDQPLRILARVRGGNEAVDVRLHDPAVRIEQLALNGRQPALDGYLAGLLDPFVTLLEAHKLMYFMQVAGEPLRLNFSKEVVRRTYAWNKRKRRFSERHMTLE